MVNLLPIPGQALRIRQTNDVAPHFRSRLIEADGDNLYIDPPSRTTGERLNLSLSDEYWIEYRSSDGALCMFPTNAMAVITAPTLWVIQRPANDTIIRQQRREFVRVDVDIPVRLEEKGGRTVDVRSRDISGGGLGLWLPQDTRCAAGDIVSCKFSLPKDDFPVDCECLVIRVGDWNEDGYAPGSFQFHQMREAVRQKIIQFTFWRQLYLSEMFGRQES